MAVSSGVGSGAESTMNDKDIALLKKAQSLSKSMASQLLQALPQVQPARSANPPGIGGRLDLVA
jgi:hypothetical protein